MTIQKPLTVTPPSTTTFAPVIFATGDPGAPGQGHVDSLAAVVVAIEVVEREQRGQP